MLAGLVVRIALLAYPSGWRRRYGRELENLTIDILADRRTIPGRLVVLSGVVGHGMAARMRAAESARGRVAVTSVSLLVATVVVATSIPSDELPVRYSTLSPLVRLGTGVSVVPPQRTKASGPGHPKIVVQVPQGANPQISVTGAPAAVVIDPKSSRVLSIRVVNANHHR
jgi:hypothetical protein